jgi:hypothetical protein
VQSEIRNSAKTILKRLLLKRIASFMVSGESDRMGPGRPVSHPPTPPQQPPFRSRNASASGYGYHADEQTGHQIYSQPHSTQASGRGTPAGFLGRLDGNEAPEHTEQLQHAAVAAMGLEYVSFG